MQPSARSTGWGEWIETIMSDRKPKPEEPVPAWKAHGWPSEEVWREARRKAEAKHKALAKAAGIPWK